MKIIFLILLMDCSLLSYICYTILFFLPKIRKGLEKPLTAPEIAFFVLIFVLSFLNLFALGALSVHIF